MFRIASVALQAALLLIYLLGVLASNEGEKLVLFVKKEAVLAFGPFWEKHNQAAENAHRN